MKTVIYECPFIPAEWIAAHGLRPSRVQPPAAGAILSLGSEDGTCPYARACLAAFFHYPGDAIVYTTTCDQMRRGCEVTIAQTAKPVFVLHVPKTWEQPEAPAFYREELLRLSRFLVSLGGHPPSTSKLSEALLAFDDARRQLVELRSVATTRQFSEFIARFNQAGDPGCMADIRKVFDAAPPAAPARKKIPIALFGSPLMSHHYFLFDILEKLGGRIVLDGTTTGELGLPGLMDRQAIREDPLQCLVNAYFGTIPDAFRRPNNQLYTWFREKGLERGVRGILFRHYVWCDTWHSEAQRLKEWSSWPVVSLETGEETQLTGHTLARLQSLIEMLQ